MSDHKFISLDEAVCRVGEALFRGEWIGELTDRESWLIERYVTGTAKPEPHSSIRSGKVSYSIGGHTWAEFPVSPELTAQVARALDRREHMQNQIEAAFDWLEKHGFDVDADTVLGEALAREFRKYGLVVQRSAAMPEARAPAPATNTPARMPRLEAENACSSWLAGEMRASPQARPKRKGDYLKEAKTKFRQLSERGFERAWANAICQTKAEWDRPGPTPRSPH